MMFLSPSFFGGGTLLYISVFSEDVTTTTITHAYNGAATPRLRNCEQVKHKRMVIPEENENIGNVRQTNNSNLIGLGKAREREKQKKTNVPREMVKHGSLPC